MMRLAGSHLLAALTCCTFSACLCSRQVVAQSSLRERALSAYFDNRTDSALLLFRAAVHEQPGDATLLAWLGEAAVRSGNASDAAAAADEALRVDPCNAHAHLVRAYLFMPRFATAPHEVNNDSVWSHVTRAVQCDPADGNAWAYVWKYGVMRGDTAAESHALRALISSGFLTSSQLTYAEWVLRSLPPNAVLMTAGDLDTYAPLAIQVARGIRPDVAVINATMLSASWYAHPVLARHHLNYHWQNGAISGPNEPQRILEWLGHQAAGRGGRPVAFALTGRADTTRSDGRLQLAGPYWLVIPGEGVGIDSVRIDASLSHADKLDWRGPGVSPSDRSPIHGLAEKYPALMVARLMELANRFAPRRDHNLHSRQKVWLRNFLRRAETDSSIINRTLEELRR